MTERFFELKEKIQLVKLQLNVLNILGVEYIIASSSGEEQHVIFDIEQMFRRQEYHSHRALYHAENFINSWENFKVPTPPLPETNLKSEYCIQWNSDTIYFEFDSFIATSSSLFEEPFRKDAQNCFEKNLYKEFEQIFPDKSSSESLLWRLTIIRNRVVHPDHPTSSKNGYRYIEFKSKLGNMVKIIDGVPVELQAHLVDISEHEELRIILKEQVIDKTKEVRNKFKERVCDVECMAILPDFHSIIFNNSGKVVKNAKMMMSKGSNLFESFISICHEILDYLLK